MCSIEESEPISDTFSDEFTEKLKLELSENDIAERFDQNDEDELVSKNLKHRDEESDDDDDDDEEESDDDSFEFSFACMNPDASSPVSPEQLFSNGEIRPVFPLFNRDLLFTAGENEGDSLTSSASNDSSLRSPLRRVFVEKANNLPSTSTGIHDEEDKPVGEFCVWSGKTNIASSSPEKCKKSNSTGFSKLWRFRDLLHRSSSDGKDAFVLLHHHHSSTTKSPIPKQDNKSPIPKQDNVKAGQGGKVRKVVTAGEGGRKKASSSAHEMHYVRNRAMKEGDRRRSYLPYRQDLVGFFTNVNGLSRNVHPY